MRRGHHLPNAHTTESVDQQSGTHEYTSPASGISVLSDAPRKSVPSNRVQRGLSAQDDALLRAIARLQFVTAQHMTRLFYQPGSLAYARGRLKALTEGGYLLRLRLPSAGPGNTCWVYTLATGGLRYLHAFDMSATGQQAGVDRFRPSEQVEHSWLFLTHTLAVTDVLVAALGLSRTHPDIVLADLRHERLLRRQPPVKVVTLRGETVGVIPDAWLDFVLSQQSKQARMSVLLELDRGTIERAAMKRKLRALLAYADGPYQQAFESTSLSIAVATTSGQERCNRLRAWCEETLRELSDAAQRAAYAGLFLFTALPPTPIGSASLEPDALFLAPAWRQPFTETPISLLALEETPTSPSRLDVR